MIDANAFVGSEDTSSELTPRLFEVIEETENPTVCPASVPTWIFLSVKLPLRMVSVVLSLSCYSINFLDQLRYFRLKEPAICAPIGVVGCLDCEFPHSLQHISDIIGGVFNYSQHRKPVIGILSGHIETPDLGGHSLSNSKTAASSAALLIFFPEESRSIAVLSSAPDERATAVRSKTQRLYLRLNS